MKVNILDVHIDNLSKLDVLDKVRQFLHDGQQHKIFTPNPEMLVLAARDEEFHKILRGADILVPDGFGLILVSHLLGTPFRERITGVDLVWEITKIVMAENESIFLLGGTSGVAQKAMARLKSLIQDSKPLIHLLDGIKVDVHTSKYAVNKINEANSTILFVALGQGKQEKFIHENLSKMPSVKVAIGIGGALDFISGQVYRAPQFLQKFGFEWLWRLVLQPRRFLRIVNAVIIFPIKVFIWRKINNPKRSR